MNYNFMLKFLCVKLSKFPKFCLPPRVRQPQTASKIENSLTIILIGIEIKTKSIWAFVYCIWFGWGFAHCVIGNIFFCHTPVEASSLMSNFIFWINIINETDAESCWRLHIDVRRRHSLAVWNRQQQSCEIFAAAEASHRFIANS